MPRKTNRNYKKKKYQNKISSYPFPKTQVAKLRYVEEINLNMTEPGLLSNGIAFQSFRANGIFDPNATVSSHSHQPRGRDTYATLYDKYVVLGSKITVQPMNIDSVATNSAYYGVIRRNETDNILNGSQTIGDIMESKEGVWAQMNGFRSGGNPRKLTMKYGHKKEFKTCPVEHQVQMITDPHGTAGMRYDVYMIPRDTLDSDPGPCPVLVTLEYIVLFTDAKHLAQS